MISRSYDYDVGRQGLLCFVYITCISEICILTTGYTTFVMRTTFAIAYQLICLFQLLSFQVVMQIKRL